MSNIVKFITCSSLLLLFFIGNEIFMKKTNYKEKDERFYLEVLKAALLGFKVQLVLNFIIILAMLYFEQIPVQPVCLIIISCVISCTVSICKASWYIDFSLFNKKTKISYILLGVAITISIGSILYKQISKVENHDVEHYLSTAVVLTCYLAECVTLLVKKIYLASIKE